MSKSKRNRELLKDLSQKAEKIRSQKIETAKTESVKNLWRKRSVNWLLLHEVYNVGEATEFKTFEQWKLDGATVRRNEKAFVIWGQLIEENNYSFFPLVYLFSDLQVYKPKPKEEAKQKQAEPEPIAEPINGDDL